MIDTVSASNFRDVDKEVRKIYGRRKNELIEALSFMERSLHPKLYYEVFKRKLAYDAPNIVDIKKLQYDTITGEAICVEDGPTIQYVLHLQHM